MSRSIFTIGLILLMVGGVNAGTIKVPADYATIQAGIDAAVNGDTVLVADNTYYENINFKGKAITVASYFLMDGDTTHIDSTIINGSQPTDLNKGSVVSYTSGEDTMSVICGFTITGGTGTLYASDRRIGGGIYCLNSGARISHNKIIHNSITHNQNCNGGGIGTWPRDKEYPVIIENNLIASNSLDGGNDANGAGIRITHGRIIHNKILSNSVHAQSRMALGGGISASCEQIPTRTLVKIIDNIITNNQAVADQYMYSGYGGGIDAFYCNIELVRNVITHNVISGPELLLGGGVRIWGAKDSVLVQENTISFNSFMGNGNCAGGGLHVSNSDLSEKPAKVIIQGNRFESNTGSVGGGLYTSHNPGCVVSDNEFIYNFAIDAGGGIYDYDSNPLTISNNVFLNNRANNEGGGLLVTDSDVLIVNNLIAWNESRCGGGCSIDQFNREQEFVAQIINNTITANVADSAGGVGIWYHKKVISLNNICWENDAPFSQEMMVMGSELHMAYSNIRFGADSIKVEIGGVLNWLEGNLLLWEDDDEPQFIADDMLFHLTPSKSNPCINSGVDSLFIAGVMCYCPHDDYEGEPRPFRGTKPDMGADETDVVFTGIELPLAVNIPGEYVLYQNYPNPFNPSTTIEFALPKAAFVMLKVYNLLGEEVATLIAEQRSAGIHKLNWDARGLASGVYLYRLEAGDFVQMKKLLLIH